MRGVLIACTFLIATSVIAAPNQRRYDNDDVRSAVYDMQHEVGNQQVEMRVFGEHLETLDISLDTIREELKQLKQQQKDKIASSSQDMDVKLGTLDISTKGIVSDLKSLKAQINDTTTALGQFKGRLAALEKVIEGQNTNIDALQAALSSLTDVLQGKEGGKATKVYVVKSGDALEKIARANQMSIDEIKELNGLTNTKIIIGQKLQVYER